MPPLQLRLAVPHTPVSFHRETSVPPPTLSVPSGQGPLSPPFLSRLLSLHTNTGRRPEHFRDRVRPGPESIHVLCLHVVEGLQELSAHPRWQVAFGGHLALTRTPWPRIQDRQVVVVVVVCVCDPTGSAARQRLLILRVSEPVVRRKAGSTMCVSLHLSPLRSIHVSTPKGRVQLSLGSSCPNSLQTFGEGSPHEGRRTLAVGCPRAAPAPQGS